VTLKIDAMIHLLLSLFAAGALMGPVLARASGPVLDLSLTDSTMSADMDDRPLNEVLRIMAEKGIILINGRIPGGEPLTLHFRRLTLDQALPKIMRGYNYVVIDRGKAQAPLLTVIGKIVWSRPGASAAPEAPPFLPPEPDSRSYAPPVHREPPEVPVGKDGQPLPHMIDDEGRVHLTGQQETSPKTEAAEAGQKQGSEQQQPGAGSTGASVKNQASNQAP
jgi:hypothetical protein